MTHVSSAGAVERRKDPLLDGKAVTFDEMCQLDRLVGLSQEKLQDRWEKMAPALQDEAAEPPQRLDSMFPAGRLAFLSTQTPQPKQAGLPHDANGSGQLPATLEAPATSADLVVLANAAGQHEATGYRELSAGGRKAKGRGRAKAKARKKRGSAQLAIRDARRSGDQVSESCARALPHLCRLSKECLRAFMEEELTLEQRSELTRYCTSQKGKEVLVPLRSAQIDVTSQEGKDAEQAVVDRLRVLASVWKPQKTAADVLALRAIKDERREEANAVAEQRKRQREAGFHARLESTFRRRFARRRDLTTDQMIHGWRAGSE